MSSPAALLQFAAEFVLFLAATAGVGSRLVGADRDARGSAARLMAITGFVMLAASAMLRGSNLAGPSDTAQVVGLRGAGVLLVAAESVRSPRPRQARAVLWLALLLLVAAGASDVVEAATPSGLLLVAGAAVMGVSVVLGERSIATRVSTSAAAIVLVVVSVLGVALSALLVTTVEDGVVERLTRRSENEAARAQEAAADLASPARIVAGSLGAGPLRPQLERLADQPIGSAALTPALSQLSETFLENISLAYVARRGTVQGAVNLTVGQVVALTGSDAVRQALATASPRNGVEVVEGSALAIRVQPVPLGGPPPLLGVAVAAAPLDRTYLERASTDDADLALALFAPDRVLASFGPTVSTAQIGPDVARALEGDEVSRVVGGRYVSVVPVDPGAGSSSVALVASYPTSLVADTRDALFRILFLIALSGTVIALGLASLVGARLGRRLGVLTEAARAIRRGEPVPRTGITSDDEVGVLSAAFDAMAQSVTEKTAAESELRVRLQGVVAGMGEALVAVDADGCVTVFNPAAEALLGVARAEALGRPLADVVHLTADDGSSLDDGLRAAQPWRGRGRVETAAGVQVPVAVSVGTLDLPGVEGRRGRVVNLRDLRAEEQVERMKTELLSRFSHEYRTPLTPIMGYARQLAGDGEVPPDMVREWGSTIFEKSKALERIVQMQEFFAQAAAGRMEMSKEWVDPADLVDDAVRRWRPRLTRAPGIARRVERTLPRLYQDRTILGRCLDELIDNADKFSTGRGRIVVRAAAGPDHTVVLSVADAGIGMSPEKQQEAFQRFGQGDPSETRAYGGLGLGLPFVQASADALGGTVRCESSPGSGTKLSIVLPAVPTGG